MVRSRPLLDRSRPKVGRGFLRYFLNFTCAHIVDSGHTKNYGKTRKTKGIYGKTRKLLRRREGGGCIFIYSRSARRISFEISCHYSWFQKKFVGQDENIWICTPPINALVSALSIPEITWHPRCKKYVDPQVDNCSKRPDQLFISLFTLIVFEICRSLKYGEDSLIYSIILNVSSSIT